MNPYCAWLKNGIGDRLNILEQLLTAHDPSESDFYWLKSRYDSNYDPYKFFDISLPLTIVHTDDIRSKSEEVLSLYGTKNVYSVKGNWKNKPPLFTKYFRLKKCVTQLVDDLDLTNCIGIHLRCYEAPFMMNNKEMNRGQELNDILIEQTKHKINKYETYFIASDSQYILDHFRDYKNVTIIPTVCKKGYCDRGSEDAFYFDLCNLYALSKCKSIYRSYGGFSILASVWGGKELLKLDAGYFNTI